MKITTIENAKKVPFTLNGRIMFRSENAELVHLSMKSGEQIPPHSNPFDVVFYVLEGSGKISVELEQKDVSKDNVLYVKAGLQRGINNTGKDLLRVLVVKLFSIQK